MKESHPIADIFPMMTEPEFNELSASIQEHGLRDPIILLDGKVLDGRNREKACFEQGVAPRYVDFLELETDHSSPTEFVLDKNYRRRHLTVSQRAAAATKALPFFEQEAKERQRLAGAMTAKPEPETSTELDFPFDGEADLGPGAPTAFDTAPETAPEPPAAVEPPETEQEGPVGVYGVVRSGMVELVRADNVESSDELMDDPDAWAVCGPVMMTDETETMREVCEKISRNATDYLTISGKKLFADGEADMFDEAIRLTMIELPAPEKPKPAKKPAGKKGKATEAVGEKFNVSARTVERADELQKRDPEAFARVERGETTVSAELKRLDAADADKAAKEAEYDGALQRITLVCGKDFGDAVKRGDRLKKKADVLKYAALSDDQMIKLRGLLASNWDLKRAMNYQFVDLCRTHKISDLLARTAAQGGAFTFEVDGYRITVERMKEEIKL